MKPRASGGTGPRTPETGGSPSLLRSVWEFGLHRMMWSEVVPFTGIRPRASLRASGLKLSPRRLDRYLRITRGSVVGGAAARVLPPTAPSIWEGVYLFDLLRIADLPFPSGIINLGAERILVRTLEANEEVRLDLAILKAWSWRGGTRLQIGSTICNSAGHLCAEGEIHLLLYGLELDLPAYERGTDAERNARPPTEGWDELASWSMGAGLGRSYASVSGDINPIHLSSLTAKWFGFPRAIAHGACIEAMIAHELIRGKSAGDPAGLRRMLTRFTSPLLLPAEVVLLTHSRGGDTGASFKLVDRSSPATVYAIGEWV